MTGNNFVSRYLGGVREDVEAVPHPERPRGRGPGASAGSAAPTRGARPPGQARGRGRRGEDQPRAGSEFDVLITPTVGETAVEIGRWGGKGALRTLLGISRTFCFTPIWNHTGQPAMAVPAGFTAQGHAALGDPGRPARAASRR